MDSSHLAALHLIALLALLALLCSIGLLYLTFHFFLGISCALGAVSIATQVRALGCPLLLSS